MQGRGIARSPGLGAEGGRVVVGRATVAWEFERGGHRGRHGKPGRAVELNNCVEAVLSGWVGEEIEARHRSRHGELVGRAGAERSRDCYVHGSRGRQLGGDQEIDLALSRRQGEQRRGHAVKVNRDALKNGARKTRGLVLCTESVTKKADDRARHGGSGGAKGRVADNGTDTENRKRNRFAVLATYRENHPHPTVDPRQE